MNRIIRKMIMFFTKWFRRKPITIETRPRPEVKRYPLPRGTRGTPGAFGSSRYLKWMRAGGPGPALRMMKVDPEIMRRERQRRRRIRRWIAAA